MPLSAADIKVLSRLFDQGKELAAGAREAWLATLPAEQQPLVAHLRQMLLLHDRPQDDEPLSGLPRLPGLLADEAPDASPGERVGPYRLISEIGRGGMGSVWLAERADGIFQREVALKLPRLSRGPQLAERMAQERQIGALLEHPHIARLYDAGIDELGRPYLVMERVQGQPLLKHSQEHGLDIPQRLRLMLQVCSAVAHAHRQLVVHRDIKPSNLLVDSDGQVKLLDFGIAKLLDAQAPSGGTPNSESLRTHTPHYAAPEQLAGAAAATTMDIYALGVVLFELLTGELPTGLGAAAAQRGLALGPDLHAVLQKAMQPQPADRYGSVERLIDDLECVLARKPVQARPASWRRSLWLFALRHRLGLSLAASAGAMAIGAGIVMLQQHWREQDQLQREAQAREFIFSALEDAEPMEGQTADQVTGVQIVMAALDRAKTAFEGQPLLHGQVLADLGAVLRRMDQRDQSVGAVSEAIKLLEAGTDDAPETLLARARVAIVLQSADPAKAEALANQAIAGCRAGSHICALVQSAAHDALTNVQTNRGDAREALVHAKLAVVAEQRAFPGGRAALAEALYSLAISLRSAGEFKDAEAAVNQAQAMANQTGMRALSRRALRAVDAYLLGDLGHYEEARTKLAVLISETADIQWRAIYQRVIAQDLMAEGLLADTVAAANAAQALAESCGDDLEAALALQAKARARAWSGLQAQALGDLAVSVAMLNKLGVAQHSVLQMRSQRLAAELALRAGQHERARGILLALQAAHQQALPAGLLPPVELAQVLDLLGTLARMQGDAGMALRQHADAETLLAQALPSAHPLRSRNALLMAIAVWLNGDHRTSAESALPQLRQAAQRYADTFPAGSVWRQIPDASAPDRVAWQNLLL